MIQTERIADGRRRFFTAPGVVQDVLLRARKGHQDRGLERGRDYEVETGGVTLRTVPKAGETVIILTGDREQADMVSAERAHLVPVQSRPIPANAPAPIARPDKVGAEPACLVQTAPPTDSVSRETIAAPAVIKAAPAVAAADLERLKRALVLATRDTNDATPRTAKWQDGLAQLTAVLLAAPDWDALRAASLDIETYLRG